MFQAFAGIAAINISATKTGLTGQQKIQLPDNDALPDNF